MAIRLTYTLAIVAATLLPVKAQEPSSPFLNFTPEPTPSVDYSPPEPVVETLAVSLPKAMGIDAPSLGSPRWTWGPEASIFDHLEGPIHKVDTSGLSQAEAIDLHNRLHNAETRGVQVVAQVQDCPDGTCPLDYAPAMVRSRTVTRVQSCPSGSCPTGPIRNVIRAAPVRRTVTAPVRYFTNRQPIRTFFRNGGFFRRCR